MKPLFLFLFCISIVYCNAQTGTGIYNYPQVAFDSDTCCWRLMSEHKEYSKAAKLIELYLITNKKGINKHSLRWHVGQLYASAGDNHNAKRYFRKTFNIFYKWFGGEDGGQWYYYAKGNIAFVNRNKTKLQRIIRKWDKHYTKEINYRALNTMLANWNKPYADANP